ncbi:MAG TPA: carbohydrate ABC transporter permease [Clostridiales bacterium]|nr:carbohydrate ABC transporter permease [Clostridiales bacterium]
MNTGETIINMNYFVKKHDLKHDLTSHRWILKIKKYLPRVILYTFLLAISFIFIYPFLYMIVTSLKSNEDLNNFIVVWIPRTLHFNNYLLAAKLMNFSVTFKNSAITTALATIGQLISCSMAGYGMARFKFPGKRLAFFIVILALIVPAQAIIVPQYLLYSKLGWLNTYFPLTVPAFLGFGFKGALYIFIFRQFYLGLPKELEEAAGVDGCGFLRTYIKIVFPIARSAYMVVLVLALVWHWSNYFEPAIFVSRTNLRMLSSGINNIADTLRLPPETLVSMYNISDENTLNTAVLMAGTFIVVLPILIMFGILQKQFIQGIERTGLTGE